jgi:PST family polysaccharide transporter
MTSRAEPPDRNAFKSRTLAGLRWSVAEQLGNQLFQFLTSIVLARLLEPSDFGLVGMILVFTGFAASFSDLGLGAALIQRQDVRPEHLESAFWVNVAAGLCITLIMAAASPLIADFYGEPRLQSLTAFVSLSFVLSSLSVVQRARLRKAMDFRRLAVVAWTGKLVVGVASISLAFAGFGAWSLAINSVASSAVTTAILWSASSWRPRMAFDRGALSELLGFSSHYFGFQAINYWLRNADNLLVGKYLGTVALGLYARAYALLLLPVHIGSTLNRVMFPALSSIQGEPARVGRIYLSMCQATVFITAPMMFGLIAVAEPFVLVVFGAKWAPMVELLQILSLVGFVQSVGTLVGNLFLSMGRSDLMLRVGGVTGVLGVTAMLLGLRHGVTGVASYYAVVSCLVFLPQQHLALRLVGLSVTDLLPKVWGPTAAAAVMSGVVMLLGRNLPGAWPLPLRLALQVVTGALCYWLLVHWGRSEPYLQMRAFLGKRRSGNA